MDEDLKTLSDYIGIAWRRKFHIAIPFLLVLLVTVGTVMVLPPVYKSTGTILIESQQIPQELIQSTVTSFADERIQIIQQRIMTSQQLLEIIKKFDLYADEMKTTARSKILADMKKRITIDRVSANVTSQRRGASALIAFTVSFEHGFSGTAQKVANELITLFLDENIRSRTARAEETSKFLRQETERLNVDIERMEAQIAAFKQENEGSLPQSLRLNLERVLSLKEAQLRSENSVNELNERRKLLLIDLEILKSKPTEDSVESAEQIQRKQGILALQNQYVSLSARYGSEHPDVKSVKRQIEAFEDEYGLLDNLEELEAQQQQVREELEELSAKYAAEHPDVKKLKRKLEGIVSMIESQAQPVETESQEAAPSAEYLQAKAKLEAVDNNIARLSKARKDLDVQILELEAKVSKTPQVESGLDTLERDYENTKRKYQEMKAKQLQAELSKSLEEEQKGERFTLLEPPLRPDKPIKPNRPKLMALGFVLSMVCGLGIAGLAETLDGGIRGSRALANVTRMTPLVTIPYITTRKDEAIRKRNIKVILAALVILGIAGVVAIHFFYKPLDLLWFILLRKLNLT